MTATQAVRPDHRRIRSENRPKDNNPRFPLKISFHKTAQPTCPAFPLPFLPLLLARDVLISLLKIDNQPLVPFFPRRLAHNSNLHQEAREDGRGNNDVDKDFVLLAEGATGR